MYLAVKIVVPLEDYKLKLIFENGEIKVFDLKPYLETGVFKELKNIEYFNTVKISFDTIGWQNGADIDPEELYNMSVSVNSQVAEDQAEYGH